MAPLREKVATMVGNSTPVTAALARTPAPAHPYAKPRPAQPFRRPATIRRLPAKDLPVAELAELAVDVERAVQRLNELMTDSQRSLRFQVDEISGRTVITVLDSETKRGRPADSVARVARSRSSTSSRPARCSTSIPEPGMHLAPALSSANEAARLTSG